MKGNFSFASYWIKDPVIALAYTLHVIRPTSDEMLTWTQPQGVAYTSQALDAMRAA